MKNTLIISTLAILACSQNTTQNEDSQSSASNASSLAQSSSVLSSSSSSLPDSMRITGFEQYDTLYPQSLWNPFNDNSSGGGSQSQINVSSDPATGSAVMKLQVALSKQTLPYDPNAGMAFHIAADGSPYCGFSYRYRGAAHFIRFETAEVTDYDFHYFNVPASASWTTISVYWSKLNQEGWGTHVAFSPAHINTISWNIKGPDGTQDSLLIDDLAWAFPAPPATPDFAIRPSGDPRSSKHWKYCGHTSITGARKAIPHPWHQSHQLA